jgi:hypothetical protein
MKNIATALVKAQSEMSNPTKGNTNPFFKSKYADLNAVREAVIPILNANGISVLQPIVHLDNKNFVKTVLIHESGEMLESFVEIIYNKQNDAQAQGSGITYARRYGLQSFVCVGADDDDGNRAAKPISTEVVLKPIDVERLNTRLKASTTVEELGNVYKSFSPTEQKFTKTYATELKEKLTLKTA